MSNVLVTGGAGFIGNSVVNNLFKEGKHEIVVLDNFSEQIHSANYEESYLYQDIKSKCHIIKGDVRNRKDVEKALDGIDYIIHLAAETGTGQSMYEINKYTDVNIMGTSNIIDVIMNNKLDIKKMILSSSRSVYGEGMYLCKDHGIVIPHSREVAEMKKGNFSTTCPKCGHNVELCLTTEDCVINPISYYAYTKLAQEKMLETMCPMMGIPYTIFRYQNVYGAGQSLNNPYTGILSIFSKLLLQNKPLNIFEDGKESRDFVHVSDVARITVNALENSRTDYQYINVGSGENVSVLEVAQTLKNLYTSESEIKITGDFRKGDIRHNIADISKAEKLCDFKPAYNFKRGIQEFATWVELELSKDNSLGKDDKFERSLNEMKAVGMMIQK